VKTFIKANPYQGDRFYLEQIRDLLYLLVEQADVARNRGEWPAKRWFQEKYMEEAKS
jgi:hypothetical protein